MSATNNPTCASCRWWREFEHTPGIDQTGKCRRYAPRPVFEEVVPVDEALGFNDNVAWPRTAHYDWCGEYAPVAAVQPAPAPQPSRPPPPPRSPTACGDCGRTIEARPHRCA